MPTDALLQLGVVLFACSVLMASAWLVQKRTGNAGVVDVAWAFAMAVAALFYGALGEGSLLNRLLMAMMAGIWGFRLTLFLLARVLHEHEDGRYAALREHWNGSQLKFFGFFQAQALATLLFSLPFFIVAQNPVNYLSLWTVLAVLIWVISVVGEMIADMQLARFRANPRNKGTTCREGLWRYSRHPNYFFEWLHWYSYVFLAIGAPWWWLSLSGVVLMGISLCWVTGIPFAEKQALRSRGDDYRAYQRETSMLIPWFPRQRPPTN